CGTSAPNDESSRPGTATAIPLFRRARAAAGQDSPRPEAQAACRGHSAPPNAARTLSGWRRMASSSSSPAPASAGESLRQNRILSSRLYLEVPPSKVPVIYSPAYDISFLGLEKL
ncbi:unnamed protein product, partial [Urochloa humidicola]